MNELLKDYPVTVELPIAWGEMDAFEHVNNIIYLRYFECARIEYFNRLGFMQSRDDLGIGPILASTSCKYIFPLTFPDQITVGARVESLDDDRFLMKFAIASHKHQRLAAVGDAVIVSFDYRSNRKTAIPESITEKIIAIEEHLG